MIRVPAVRAIYIEVNRDLYSRAFNESFPTKGGLFFFLNFISRVYIYNNSFIILDLKDYYYQRRVTPEPPLKKLVHLVYFLKVKLKITL